MSQPIASSAGESRARDATGGPVTLYGVSSQEYEALLDALSNQHPSLRLTYCEGALEITTTLPEHERLKKLIARLVELWALERDVPFGAARRCGPACRSRPACRQR